VQALEFWKAVTMDTANALEAFLALLDGAGVRYCAIGGQAVNAYVEPLVSLDLDLVVAADETERVEALLPPSFTVRRFPHSLNITIPGSDLRIQIQTDPRYFDFVDRATTRTVLGTPLPVASLEDVLRGKVWAAEDPTRRGSKRQKDLADIARIIEAFPELRGQVPEVILSKLI
jgi:hypothetical protein